MEVDGAKSSAWRRRERRLRSWVKHERQTVAMALAEALHHSAPRRPKTARARVRAGVLEDPETEHELYAAPRGPKSPSPGVPSLATPLLAGQATEELDASTLAFLTRAVLEEKKKAEAEKAERDKAAEAAGGGARGAHAGAQQAGPRTTCRSLQPSTRLGRSVPVALCPLPGRGGRGKRGGRKSFLGVHGCRRPCVHQRQVAAVCTPVVKQRQVPTVHSFILAVQLLDKVLDVPVVVLRQVPGLMVQKTVVRPQLQSIYGR